ncbi:hypothetical protein KKD62_02410 [Patescibacteria group bacterium]|nr:hypothetical protein [Patescibacteria group bacterium]MBU1931721.1 hypothetical protein [Patescibacteria group bacterium]
MAFKINLLAARSLEIRKQRRRQAAITVISLAALGVFVIFLIGLTSYAAFLQVRYRSLERQLSETEIKIKAFSDLEMQYVYLKDKAGVLVEILEQTKKQQAIASYILDIFPREIPLGGFSVEDDWLVSIEGKTDSFSLLQESLSRLSAFPPDNKLVKLRGIVLNALSRDSKGFYNFSLDLQFE